MQTFRHYYTYTPNVQNITPVFSQEVGRGHETKLLRFKTTFTIIIIIIITTWDRHKLSKLCTMAIIQRINIHIH